MSSRKKNVKEAILINSCIQSFKIPISKERIKYIIKYVLKHEKCKLDEILINLITDKDIREINKNYLNHNYPTDIITFNYSPFYKKKEAEVFISLETVRENSKFYKISFKNELLRVIIHGCLHIAGYRDKTSEEKELMRKKENYYLGKINLN